MKNSFELSGWIVDILGRRTFAGTVVVIDGLIDNIFEAHDREVPNHYIIPGFIDSHVHIESSMLIPSQFARIAVTHGTTATVSDPHEIANVCGMEGIDFMIDNGNTVPFKFNFGAPSCVPATNFETAGASISPDDVCTLLKRQEIRYLTEMMNFPGVLNNDPEVMQKITHARKLNKPIDGHAPGLRGEDAVKYINAGISTDHECFTKEEAIDKLNAGMKILIREGNAAKNFDALVSLLHDHYERIMFCSDDKHPDSLVDGHINQLCARAVNKGIDVYKVLQSACINPVQHYELPCGLLNPGDPADLVVIDDLVHFKALQTYINGIKVAENGESYIGETEKIIPVNNFNCDKINAADLQLRYNGEEEIAVIEAYDGQLITGKLNIHPTVKDNTIIEDIENDILKLVVVNRYTASKPSVAFIKNFGLKKGAIASSVAHDSHNIVAVGVNDESIAKAINLVIEKKGGISCVWDEHQSVLALPVAGLMSMEDGYAVAKQYTDIDRMAKDCGSRLSAPFMTLSFMSLLVIPHLKLSDKGLFDGDSFKFVGV